MKNWSDAQIKQFKHEIEWLQSLIPTLKSKKQIQEYQRQIRKKELEIAFNVED